MCLQIRLEPIILKIIPFRISSILFLISLPIIPLIFTLSVRVCIMVTVHIAIIILKTEVLSSEKLSCSCKIKNT